MKCIFEQITYTNTWLKFELIIKPIVKQNQFEISQFMVAGPVQMFLLCCLPALAEGTYRDHFCRLAPSSASQKISVTFFWNHTGQLPDIWHRASVWRTVSCNTVLNLRLVHFLSYATLNIVDIGKLAHKIIFVTFLYLKEKKQAGDTCLPWKLTTKFLIFFLNVNST